MALRAYEANTMGELSALRISVKIVEYALDGPTTRFGWRPLVLLLGADMLRAWMVELTRKIFRFEADDTSRIPSSRYRQARCRYFLVCDATQLFEPSPLYHSRCACQSSCQKSRREGE